MFGALTWDSPLTVWLVAVATALQVSGGPATVVVDEDFCTDCCNFYCAAYPTPTVSAHLGPDGKVSYGPDLLQDGDRDTAWVVDGGPGAWFELTFLEGEGQFLEPRLGVNELRILNGYAKSPRHWRQHARIREMDLLVDGQLHARISLLDDERPQMVALPNVPLHPGLELRFVIVSVFPGEEFDQTAVSEVRVEGYGDH